MERPKGPILSFLGLIILVLTPLPLLYWAGEKGIQTLEENDLTQRNQESKGRLKAWFETALENPTETFLLGSQTDLHGAKNPYAVELSAELLLDLPFARRAWVLSSTQPGALRALDVVGPWIRDKDPRASTVASVCAIRALVTLNHSKKIQHLKDRAIQSIEDLTSDKAYPVLSRWLEIVASAPDVQKTQIDSWAKDVMLRPSSLDELEVIKSLGSAALDIEFRMDLARWGDAIIGKMHEHEMPESMLGIVMGRMFIVHESRLSEILSWEASLVEAGIKCRPSSEIDGDWEFQVDSWTLDFGDVQPVIELEESTLFGGWSPRWLLLIGMGAYALLVAMIARVLFVQMRRSRELADARGELIAQVTHELRTPLSVLRMYAETLRGGLLPESKRDHYVATIAKESYRLGHAIDRVAEAARAQVKGEEPLESSEKFDIANLASELVEAFLPLGRVSPPWLVLLDPQPACVLASREDVRSILTILLENAKNYGEPQVRVTIVLNSKDRLVELIVEDQGPGISDNERERIFENWYRGTASRKRGKRGIGMGLYLARKSAESFRGTLIAQRSDRGASFRLSLPMSPQVPDESSNVEGNS